VLEPRIGDAVMVLTVIPIVGTAWLYGVRGGLVASVVLVAVDIALLQTVAERGGFHPAQLLRAAMAIAIGVVAGWIRDTTIRQQALLADNLRMSEGLERQVAERTATLTAEIAARREAEDQLQRDTAVRKELEVRAATADRMAVIGTLAAGIGHEINNPLAIITSNLEYVLDALRDPNPTLREAIEDARQAGFRAGEIIKNMRVFIQSNRDTAAASVREVVDSTVRLIANEIRHRARLELDVADTPPVRLSANMLGQILLNLLVNATHALPARPADQNLVKISVRAGADGRTVRIAVTDTGCGIPVDVRPRIFDPFFTTKPVGGGTGLGLWVCQQIAVGAGGEIAIESSGDEGTTIRIDLPVAVPAVEREPPVQAPSTDRRARVLVIEDDPIVRRTITRLLRARHEPVVMEDAVQALAAVEAGERFDVILCDVMMPVMTGDQLFERLRAIAADQAERVVFMTGGAFTPEARTFLADPRHPLLEKPFAAEDLESVIQRVLRRAA
jgi:signal transduction histidine kinase/ActR/RegA family two-component response regulator